MTVLVGQQWYNGIYYSTRGPKHHNRLGPKYMYGQRSWLGRCFGCRICNAVIWRLKCGYCLL